MAVIDSYSETNANSYGSNLNSTGLTAIGQSFTGDGGSAGLARFYARKVGSPTGNMVAKIFAHSGTFGTSSVPSGAALATSDPVDAATLTGTETLTAFTFPAPVTVTAGTKYLVTIEYSGGNGSNYVQTGIDTSSPTHGGNAYYTVSGSDTAVSSWDLVFYVESAAAGQPAMRRVGGVPGMLGAGRLGRSW